MDFGMRREEFDKFVKACKKELSNDFFLQTWNTDPGYSMPFAKVIIKNSVWNHDITKDSPAKYEGIYVDIFVFDNIVSSRFVQKINSTLIIFLVRMLMMKNRYKLKANRRIGRVCDVPLKIVSLFLSTGKIISLIVTIQTKYNARKMPLSWNSYLNFDLMNTRECYHTVDLKFESEVFPAPCNYDKVLKDCYGDYRSLPPAEERKPQHGELKIIYGDYRVKNSQFLKEET